MNTNADTSAFGGPWGILKRSFYRGLRRRPWPGICRPVPPGHSERHGGGLSDMSLGDPGSIFDYS